MKEILNYGKSLILQAKTEGDRTPLQEKKRDRLNFINL